jgi:hypothetical protein
VGGAEDFAMKRAVGLSADDNTAGLQSGRKDAFKDHIDPLQVVVEIKHPT